MYIRLVEKRDCFDLWKWRNDYETIANSISKSVISYPSHSKWFYNTINKPDAEIFIAYDEKEKSKIGMVRFEKKCREIIEVSININPDFRGRGLGKKFLSSSISKFLKKAPGFVISARVFTDNYKSKKLFESCGFSVTSTKDNIVYYNFVKEIQT